jgi:lipoyl(octanoyl) transferase
MPPDKRKGLWVDLGTMPYKPAFDIQTALYAECIDGDLPTIVIVQENNPVFTIGRTGSRSNILATEKELQELGIEVIDVNRGGDVTFHAPGQIIVSPLIFLGDIDQNANQYFHRLEDVQILVLDRYGIKSGKKEGYPGAWCGAEKIGSVGIAVRHGYTCHGFSLNVNPDLHPFGLINPCGVNQMPVTSMKKMLDREIPGEQVRKTIRDVMGDVFGFEFQTITLADVLGMLKDPSPLALTQKPFVK